jgi:hypothetical protein
MDPAATFQSFLPFLWRSAIIVLPFVLLYLFWKDWVAYIQRLFLGSLKWTLLEIRTPQTIDRSPEAMELLLNALYITSGTSTWQAMFWAGKVRTWFSLEIASIEGSVYFFIRCETKLKEIVKSQVYAFYPEAEVTEVEDYTRFVPPIESKAWELFGFEWQWANPKLGGDGIPIKTYVDYELDRQVGLKDHQKFDPIASMIEFISTLRPKEQIWIQILLRGAANRHAKPGETWKLTDWKSVHKDAVHSYTKQVQDSMVSQSQASAGKKFDELYPELAKKRAYEYMTDAEKKTVDAIQRNMNKNAFDVGIRTVYYAQKDAFRPDNIPGLGALFRLFGAENRNGLKPIDETKTDFDYAWDNFLGDSLWKRKVDMFRAFVRRSYFYPPHNEDLDENPRKQLIMSVEEVATLFHFPGKEVASSTFARVDAKKSEPPANLPIG